MYKQLSLEINSYIKKQHAFYCAMTIYSIQTFQIKGKESHGKTGKCSKVSKQYLFKEMLWILGTLMVLSFSEHEYKVIFSNMH